MTNLETGETIALNIPGPGFLNEDGSRLIGTGPWLLFDEEGGFGEGEPAQTLYTTGRFVLTFDDEGNVTSFSRPQHIVDICAALAA